MDSPAAGEAAARIAWRPAEGQRESAVARALARLDLTPALVRFVLAAFVLSRLAFVAITVVALRLRVIGSRPATLLDAWSHFDANFYARIAVAGYQPGPLAYRANFFPLQPLLAHLAAPLTGGNTYASSMLVSNLSCLAALLGLAALANGLAGERVARHTLLYLLAYPAALFLFAGYAESLFLALAIWCVIALRRGWWWQAGLLGLLATTARNAGIFLTIPFAVEYLSQRRWRLRAIRFDAAFILLIPAGLLLFMAWLAHTVGDPIAFVHTQQTVFHHRFSPPWATLWNAFPALSQAPDRIFLLRDAIDLICVLAFGALIVWGVRHQPLSLTFYSAAVWLLAISYRMSLWPLESSARYMLAAFPCFLLLARLTDRHPIVRAALLCLSAAGLIMLAQYFVRGAVIL